MLEDAMRDLATFLKWALILIPVMAVVIVVLAVLLLVKW